MPSYLTEHIKKFVELKKEEEEILNRYSTPCSFEKKENLLSSGQVCRSMYFVEKGCLRMYFINSKATEQIIQFAIDGWWLTDFFSFFDHTASEYYIEAIEPSKVIAIDHHVFDSLLRDIPQLERYFRIIFQKNLAATQLKAKYLYEMSKEEFYHHFITSFPEFAQRVPQYMIASYLGLTPEYVSKLRKKK